MNVAVVTGAASGIGRAMALELARRGASTIVLADVDVHAARRTADEATELGAQAQAHECDVRNADDLMALADRCEPPDLVVNNAGVLVTGEVADLALEDYERVVGVNLWGVVHGCRAFVPGMKRRGRGAIINVASLAGILPLPSFGAYAATKAAVIALSESLHAELADHGVRVTVLCPSFTRTEILDAATGADTARTMPLARRIMAAMGASPERVARVALDASARGRLYAVPTVHGQLAWRAKRLIPRGLHAALGAVHPRV